MWEGPGLTAIYDAILTGILTGGVYALMASGLTLIFGVLEIVNIAQGILVILGAYLSYALNTYLHMDIFLSLLITVPAMFLLGIAIERLFIRRLNQSQNRIMLSVLMTFAIALFIEGALNLIFTTDYVSLHAKYIDASFPVGKYYLPYVYVFAFVLSIVLLAGLYLLVYHTKFGYGLRALTQNRMAAALIGIDTGKIAMITVGVGVAVTAVGGMAYGATNAFNTASSYDLIARLLVIIVLGGMGSLRGAFVASLAMLVISDLTTALWSAQWSSLVFFVLLVLLLVFRPQGLFGLAEGRKQ